MKYSIRELLLLTVIVTLVAGWWVDRSRLAAEIREYEMVELPNVGGMPGMPGPRLKEWKEAEKRREEKAKRELDEWSKKTDEQKEQEAAQNEREANELFELERRQLERFTEPPDSSTPVRNPPKR